MVVHSAWRLCGRLRVVQPVRFSRARPSSCKVPRVLFDRTSLHNGATGQQREAGREVPSVPAWIRQLQAINATQRPVAVKDTLWQRQETEEAEETTPDAVLSTRPPDASPEGAAAQGVAVQPQLDPPIEEGPLAGTLSVLSRMAAGDEQLAAAVTSLRRISNRPPAPVVAAARPSDDWDEDDGALDLGWTVEGRGVGRDTAMGLLYSVPYLAPSAAPTNPFLTTIAPAKTEEDAPPVTEAGMRVRSASARVGSAVDALSRFAGDDVVLRGRGGRPQRLAASGGGDIDGLDWVRCCCTVVCRHVPVACLHA